MGKVRFGESDSLIAEVQQTAAREKAQGDEAVRKHTRIQRRIRAFYEAVEYISFPSVEEAPIWAANWLDWLLDGTVPVEETSVAEAALEVVLEDQPTPEPDGEPPATVAA